MRIATPGHTRSHLLLLATLVLVLGGGSVWLALGTARPLEAPPLPPVAGTARPAGTPAPSPIVTATRVPAATATATLAPPTGRAIRNRERAVAGHNNWPAIRVRYLHRV